MLSESDDIFFFFILSSSSNHSICSLVVFSLCSHTAVVKEDRADVALIWVMVDGEIRAGAIPPWCTATQQSVKLECMDFSTAFRGRKEGYWEDRWVRLAASGSPSFLH